LGVYQRWQEKQQPEQFMQPVHKMAWVQEFHGAILPDHEVITKLSATYPRPPTELPHECLPAKFADC